jgi:enterochelin esterase-like enzyme
MKNLRFLLFAIAAAHFFSCLSNAVELAVSIPQQYRQSIDSSGQVVKRSYSCYYYTDLTNSGVEIQARFEDTGYVLERRDEAITKECNVYLPYGYSVNKKYPVIYILHGLTDNEDTWLSRGNPSPAVLLDNLIASGTIEPCIAVFPNGNSCSSYLDRSWGNQAGYYFFANELQNDIIPFIESEYSVKTDRDSRAICGFSMGGMQTINVGLCQSLEQIAWFGAFAAAPTSYSPDKIAEYLRRQNQESSYPVNFFYNICGASDGTAGASHEAAIQGLTEKSEYLSDENFVYHNASGGHDYTVSSIGLYNLLRICFGLTPDPNGSVENRTSGERFSVIQHAINRAAPGDTIVIEPGVYSGSFVLDRDVTLQSVDPNDPFYIGGTIIQGNPDESAVTLSSDTDACILAGLTVRAGAVGISGTSTDATIRNCRIMDNTQHGLELTGASPRLNHCLIISNGLTGITMHVLSIGRATISSPVIENCVVWDNGDAGIIGGEPTIIDSIIQDDY